jgi:hypothetical protein
MKGCVQERERRHELASAPVVTFFLYSAVKRRRTVHLSLRRKHLTTAHPIGHWKSAELTLRQQKPTGPNGLPSNNLIWKETRNRIVFITREYS